MAGNDEKEELIGIAGLGFMGRGIAACFVMNGFRVVGYSSGPDDYPVARECIRRAIRAHAKSTNRMEPLHDNWEDRYREATSIADFADCTFVIESVVEDIAVKQQVFDEIERVVSPDVPIASNTSAIPITSLQKARKTPERFLGMHWAEPAYATCFMELIRGGQTSDAALQAALALAKRVGKQPCLVQRDVPGFIANRLAYAMYREAAHLLAAGVADVETIDRSFRNSVGVWASVCGPFRWMDITGGPALYAKAMREVLPDLYNDEDLPDPLKRKEQEGALGTSNGNGFFRYGEGDAQLWEERIHEQAWALHKEAAK